MRLVLAMLVATALAAGEVPYGHKDFLPTPERPIGFRGDGNGAFPGATPVSEWWPGTPRTVEMKMRRKVDQMSPLGVWDAKPAQVTVFADDRARNIAWKTRMPGGSMAQPIIVGDRIFAVCDPWWVVCLDMHSGKILWQDQLKPLLLDEGGSAANQGRQTVLELGMAMYYLSQRLQCHRDLNSELNTYGRKELAAGKTRNDDPATDFAERTPIYPKAVAAVQRWKGQVQAGDPDPALLKALDQAIAAIQARAAGDAGWDLSLHGGFTDLVRKKYNCPTQVHWQGWDHNFANSTPVSDGRQVFVTFGQGQVAAYDLDGHRQWAWRFTKHESINPFASIVPSSLLAGDTVIVRNMEGDLAGIDKKTGRILWQPDIGIGGNHGGYATSKLLRVADGSGRLRTLVVTNKGKLLDAADGSVLGEFAKGFSGHGPNIVGRGDLFAIATFGDSGNSAIVGRRIVPQGAGWAFEQVFEIPGTMRKVYTETPILTDRFLVGCGQVVWDGATGTALTPAPPANAKTSIGTNGPGLFGTLLIAKGGGDSPIGRLREDRADIVNFTVVDLADPARPKLVTTKNYLGGPELPADIIWETHLKEVDEVNSFVGGYRGITSTFGCANGGMVGQGNRLLAQSNTFLWCIGDPAVRYDGPAVRLP